MNAGYDFVPLPKRVLRVERPEAVHDRRVPGTLFAVLSLRLVTEQPVHVGTGFKRREDGEVIRQAARVRDRPGIAGASMKGVLRARYEAITLSCVLSPPQKAQGIRSSTGIKKARLSDEISMADVFSSRPEDKENRLCPACALFGRMSRRSRVTLTDFMTREDQRFEQSKIPEQFSPNLHHVGRAQIESDRHSGEIFKVDSLHGRKFAVGRGPVSKDPRMQHVEVIPAGSTLDGTLRVHNILRGELGGLLVALGVQPQSAIKIGGGKAHGLGRSRVQVLEARILDHAGAPVQLDIPGFVDAFERSDDRHEAGQMKLVQIHQGDC